MCSIKEINELEVDEKGMVKVVIGGIERRFVKDKLIAYLERTSAFESIKVPKKVKVRGKVGEHRRKPIVAILPDGTTVPFPSSAEAAKQLKVPRTNIPHALSGKYKHVCNIKFKYGNV